MPLTRTLPLVAVLLAAAAPSLEAQERRPPPPRHGPSAVAPDPTRLLERLADSLDLSLEQEKEVRRLAEEFRATNAETLERMRAMAQEMRALVNGSRASGAPPDRAELDALAERYGRPMEDLRPALERLREDVRVLLGEEQRARLDELRSRWRERHGRRGGSPGG